MKRWLQYVPEILVILLALSAGYGYGYSQGHTDDKKGLVAQEVAADGYQKGYQAGLSDIYGALHELQVRYDILASQPPQIKEVTKEIVREVQVPIKPQSWESLDQITRMFKGGIMPLQTNVCLPIAEDLQESALTQGLPVSIALAQNGYYYGVRVTDVSGGHAGLLVDIKEDWYFIDPLPWKVTLLFNEK